MPGAPAPAPSPMPQIGGFNLPAPGPSPGAQLGNALGAMPGILNQQQFDKYALEKERADAEQRAQTQDLAKLKLLTRMASTSQQAGTQLSPAFTAAAEKIAKSLGVGSFMHTDPATGQQTLDLDAMKQFASAKDLSDLTAAEIKEIWSQPAGKERDGLLLAHGVNPDTVDKRAREAPAEIDQYKLDHMVQEANNDITKYAAGGASLSTLKAVIENHKKMLGRFDIDESYLDDIVNSPEFAQDMSAGVKMKAQALIQSGAKTEAVIKWMNLRSARIPYEIQDMQSKAQYRDTMAGVAMQNLAIRQQEFTTKTQEWQMNFAQVQQRDAGLLHRYDVLNAQAEAGQPIKANRAEYDALTKSSQRWQALADDFDKIISSDRTGGFDVPPELQKQADEAHAKITSMNNLLDGIARQKPYDPARRATAASGKTTKPVDLGPNAPPQRANVGSGAKYADRAKVIEIGRKQGLTPEQAIQDAESRGYTVQ